MKTKKVIWLMVITVFMLAFNAHALIAELLTPDASGLVSGGQTWDATVNGFKVVSEVMNNGNGTWHYKYTFSNADGSLLVQHTVSHFIISVSENFTLEDLLSTEGVVPELRDFGPEPGNPGLQETMYSALKLDLLNEQNVVEFDCTRAPMWGDFYAKDGGDPKNYAYNASIGITVADPYDYTGAKDVGGAPLFKVLVPDTIPEPATMTLLGLGGLLLGNRRNKK